MLTLKQTFESGSSFEEKLCTMIRKYTKDVWRNIRIETLLTASGTTEIDILCCYKNFIFVIEAKNVISLIGDYDDVDWGFVGSKASSLEHREYTALSVITQNNIHIRSLQDLMYAQYKTWYNMIPIIIVPDNCETSSSIQNVVFTASQLEELFVQCSTLKVEPKVQRLFAALIEGDGCTVNRPDFIFDKKLGKRVRKRHE